MPEVRLQRSCVVSLVCQRVAAGVPEHVWVGLEGKPRFGACSLDHAGKASGERHWRFLWETGRFQKCQ